MTDNNVDGDDFGNEKRIAKAVEEFGNSLPGYWDKSLLASAIETYGRIVAAQVAASADISAQLQSMTQGMVGSDEPQFQDDDADVQLYEGNSLKIGHTISLKGGGKLVAVQDKANTGEVKVIFSRRVDGHNMMTTVDFDDEGVVL